MNIIRKFVVFIKQIILKILVFFGFNSIEEYVEKPKINENKIQENIDGVFNPNNGDKNNTNLNEIGTVDGIALLMDKQGNTFVRLNGKLIKYTEYLKQKEKEKERNKEMQKKKMQEQEKEINKNLNKFTYRDLVNRIREKLGLEAASAFIENLKTNKIDQNEQINQNKLKELTTQTERQLNLKNQEITKLAEQEKMLENEKLKGIEKNNNKNNELEKEKLKDNLKNTFNKDKNKEQEKADEQRTRTNKRILELEEKYGRDLDGDGYVNGDVAVGKQKYDPNFTKSVEKHENIDIDGGGVGKNPKALLKNHGYSRE